MERGEPDNKGSPNSPPQFPEVRRTWSRGGFNSIQVVNLMGDKSPKAKDKAKKQDNANKNQKKTDAANKASAAAAVRKGK